METEYCDIPGSGERVVGPIKRGIALRTGYISLITILHYNSSRWRYRHTQFTAHSSLGNLFRSPLSSGTYNSFLVQLELVRLFWYLELLPGPARTG
jgi:hypothetical protein